MNYISGRKTFQDWYQDIVRVQRPFVEKVYSWVSRNVINFTGGQLRIYTQSLEGNNFTLYALTFCLAANMLNFVRFVYSSTV